MKGFKDASPGQVWVHFEALDMVQISVFSQKILLATSKFHAVVQSSGKWNEYLVSDDFWNKMIWSTNLEVRKLNFVKLQLLVAVAVVVI